jgi:hypothetical protein
MSVVIGSINKISRTFVQRSTHQKTVVIAQQKISRIFVPRSTHEGEMHSAKKIVCRPFAVDLGPWTYQSRGRRIRVSQSVFCILFEMKTSPRLESTFLDTSTAASFRSLKLCNPRLSRVSKEHNPPVVSLLKIPCFLCNWMMRLFGQLLSSKDVTPRPHQARARRHFFRDRFTARWKVLREQYFFP